MSFSRKLSYGTIPVEDAEYPGSGNLLTAPTPTDGDSTEEETVPFLMAVSREQLTMDNAKSDSMFSRPSGCYVTRTKAFGFILMVALLAVAVGFITYNMTPCSSKNLSSSPSNASAEESQGPIKFTDVRLPTHTKPLYYKIELIPYLDPAKNFTIDGKVGIDLLCLADTNKVTIHVKNITVNAGSVSLVEKVVEEVDSENRNATNYAVVGTQYDTLRDFYNITLRHSLKAGHTYRLYMEFEALLGDELAGFYRSSYTDNDTNETRWIAITQFQATDARRAFPCFDEPNLKAEFEVSLGRKRNMSSLSNMDLNSTEDMEGMPGWVWDHYHKSVPMSTYLVAFAVTDFAFAESNRSLSTPIFKVWARPDAIEQLEFSRDVGPRVLTHFEKYFNISFPLPKLDMIALPDFSAGAMENWGLITYRESAMLYDPKISSDSSKQRVAVVISHEIAHQWFGNLVTPSWWSDLWLNEGFASYVEYIGVDFVFPEWKILDQFVTDEVHEVFGLDALDSSHPISVEVHHPDEISEIFDTISYAKGASIIRMMTHFLTQPSFNKGLTNYLNKWKYNNTVQTNLWAALTEQAHADKNLDPHLTVSEIMDTWTLQKGFPVIKVERNYPLKSATFTQTKFSLIRNESLAEEYESYRWWVPISYASNGYNENFTRTKPDFWIPKNQKAYVHDVHADKSDWLVVNVQETGYFRVNYDQRNWNAIVMQLQSDHRKIHTVNRAQLLDDSLNLARASLLPYDTAFNVTQFLRNDDEYIPWEAFLNNFHYISTMFLRSPSFGIFKKYILQILEKQYDKVGFTENPNDPLLQKYHRINILSMACGLGHADCVSHAKTLFAEWMNTTNPNVDNPIPTNFRRLVYCNGIRYGGEEEWDFVWQRYLEGNVASEKAIILSALACSRETWILNRYMISAITPDSGIRKQDCRTVLASVAGNDVGNFLAFNFVRDRWMDIKTYFSTGFSMGRVIKAIAGKLNTKFELIELQNFKRRYQHDLGSSARAVDQAIESVVANVDWMEKNFKVITEWLERSNTVSTALM